MLKRLLVIALLLPALAGCRNETSPPGEGPPGAATPQAEQAAGALLLEEAVIPATVELISDALPRWRELSERKPVLVLMSSDPFLRLVPPRLADRAQQLVQRGHPATIRRHGDIGIPDPLYLPQMSVRLALESRFFTKLVWVLPSAGESEALDLEVFREQLSSSATLKEEELRSLQATPEGFAGVVAGTPFLAVHPGKLPAIQGPVLLHLDLGYFKSLYRNEVKTAIYELLRRTLIALRKTGWDTVGITLSPGNLTGRVSLDLRFLATRLKTLFENPHMLDQPLPGPWFEQAQALYLATFLETDKVVEKTTALAEKAPDDPALHYGRYEALRAGRRGSEAMAALEETVARDPVYALEYLALAEAAWEKDLPAKALEMLDLAQQKLAPSVFIRLRRIGLLQTAGKMDEARALAIELSSLHWSDIYYPDIAYFLTDFLQASSTTETSPGG